MTETRRNFRKKLALLVGSAVVAVVATEVGLRLLNLAVPDPALYPGDCTAADSDHLDSRIGWKLPPNVKMEDRQVEFSVTYQSNSDGFRGPHDFVATPGQRSITFLGDSFTFGNGVEYESTFAHVVEQELDETRSYNLGMSGFGVDQMWMTLRHHALPLKPDVVIVSFIWADLRRALSAYRWRDGYWPKPMFQTDRNGLVPVTQEDRPGVVTRYLQRNSHLWQAMRRLPTAFSRWYPVGYQWKLNRALFSAIRDDCRAANSRLLVVFLPDASWQPVTMLAPEFERLGIEFLDLTQRTPESVEALFYETDRHLTAAGHRFAAESIIESIQSRGW